MSPALVSSSRQSRATIAAIVSRMDTESAKSSVKPRVFVTTRLPSAALEPLWGAFDVDYRDDSEPCPREVLLARVRQADGLVCLLTDTIDREVIAAAEKL